jgi:hypothetical protein
MIHGHVGYPAGEADGQTALPHDANTHAQEDEADEQNRMWHNGKVIGACSQSRSASPQRRQARHRMNRIEYTQARTRGRAILSDATIVSKHVTPNSVDTTWRRSDGTLWLEHDSNDGASTTFEYSLTRISPSPTPPA